MAKEFGVTWATVMGTVRRHGQPLIDDPERVGVVTGLGIDETSFLKGNAQHHIKLVTGFVVAWTRRDAGCRTRPSDIAAAKTIRCTGCGGSCSPVPTDSTSTARQGSCWACAPGDPHDEVTGAWLAKESVRDVYLAISRADAEALLDKTIIGAVAADVAEIRALAATLKRWRPEILARFDTLERPTGQPKASTSW